MNTTKEQTEVLQFIFTEKDFYLDAQSSKTLAGREEWVNGFESDKYDTLYRMGFEEKPGNLSATGNFLYLISDSFLKSMTSLPEL